MSTERALAIYEEAIIADTTAPLAPFTTIQTASGPDDLLNVYAQVAENRVSLGECVLVRRRGHYLADGRIHFAPPSILPDVVDELLRRGFSDGEIHGSLGGNYLRVM
jgi:hypothetical protein